MAAIEAINERQAALEKAADSRARMVAGLIAATLVNINRRKGAKLVQPKDFFPEPRRAQTPEEMAEVLDLLTERQNRIHAA